MMLDHLESSSLDNRTFQIRCLSLLRALLYHGFRLICDSKLKIECIPILSIQSNLVTVLQSFTDDKEIMESSLRILHQVNRLAKEYFKNH